MDWARIMAPMSGSAADAAVVAAGAALAAPFDAELACVHAPADVADLMPWIGDGFMGGVQASAIESIREAAQAGRAAAEAVCGGVAYGRKTFTTLPSPVWASLAMEGRLSDVVLFDAAASRGKGPLAEAFQEIVADEQRPVIVVRGELDPAGVVAIAWDGGKEASRAVRTAVPLLQKAKEAVILSAPGASSRKFEPQRLCGFLEARNVAARVETIDGGGDAGPLLLQGAKAAGAYLLVSGAFGHPRLQEYIFGGTTRTLLNSDGPSLFLSH